MTDWRKSLSDFHAYAWQELSDFETPRAGLRGLISLATVNTDANPEVRTVVLRRVDQTLHHVEIFTDTVTQKVAEIHEHPGVSALIWQPKTGIQIRLRGNASVLTGQDVAKEWQTMPDRQQINYGVTPDPGSQISSSAAYKRLPQRARLARLRIEIEQMDVVHIGEPNDIRARFCRADNWVGEWLAP